MGASTLDIVGTLATGGDVFFSINLDTTYATYTLSPSFSSLMTKVRFAATSGAGFSIDNLASSATTEVSTPTTLMLLGMALVGVGLSRKIKLK